MAQSAVQGCYFLAAPKNFPRTADGAACKRAHGAGRNAVDADIQEAEIDRQIADRGLKCCLGDAHYVVVGHHPLRSEETETDQAAAVVHQSRGALGHGGKRVTGHIKGPQKIVAAGIHISAFQFFLVRIGNGVNDEI